MPRKSQLVALSAIILCSPAFAQPPEQQQRRLENQGWGLRVALADDPDTALIGAHLNLGEIVENLRLQPNVELGFGDDHTTLFITGAVHYRFDIDAGFTPYAGGGPAMGFIERDRGRRGDDTDFEIGLKAIGGIEWQLENSRIFFLELQLGFGDIQDAQITAGWFF